MIRALLLTAASGVCLRLLTPHALAVLGSPAPRRVEDAVSQAATLTATGLTLWYLTTALVAFVAVTLRTLAGTRRPHLGRTARRASLVLETAVRRFGAPMLRSGATLGLGLGVAVGAVPALATSQPSIEDVPADLRPGAVAVEAGVTAAPTPVPAATTPIPAPTTPAPPPEASAPTPAASAPTPAPQPPAPSATPAPSDRQAATPDRPAPSTAITVADGDSLWRLAAAHLGPDADDAAIAREWPRWHAANAATIGDDPDLLHPGQVLHAPSTEVTP